MRRIPTEISLRILLAAIVMAVMAACGQSPAARQLDAADAVMEECPDSALRILTAIDTASISRERDLRLRDLLLAQARVKLDIEGTDTARLRLARDWFTEHPEKNYRLRSNFYMGDIAHDDSAFIAAAGYAADAFLDARDRNDSYWTAKSAELISFILNRCKMPGESLRYDSIAIVEYERAGKPLNAVWTKIDLAVDYGSFQKYNIADSLLNNIIPVIKKNFPNDTALMRYALVNSMDFKIKSDKYSELGNLLNLQHLYVKDPDCNAREILYRAIYLIHIDSIEKASRYINEAKNRLSTSYDSETYELIREVHARAISDSINISKARLGVMNIMKHELDIRLNNPITNILSAKQDAQNARLIKRKQNTLIITIVIAIFVILGSGCLFVHFRKKYKKRQKEYSILSEELKKLEDAIEKQKEATSHFEDSARSYQDSAIAFYHKYSSEVVKHNKEISKRKEIWNNFYHSTKTSIPIQNIILEVLHDLNGSLQNDRNRIDYMRKKIGKYLDKGLADELYSVLRLYKSDILQKFQEQIPDVSIAQMKYFIFSVSGFSSASISVLLNENVKAIYSLKLRLTEKVSKSNATDKALFIKLINQTSKGNDKAV